LDHDDGNRKWQSQYWRQIPSGLAKQINNCNSKGRKVEYVDFGTDNSWYVYGIKAGGTGGHCWWGGLDAEESDAIEEQASEPHTIKVALGGQDRQSSLCVITGKNGYQYMNVQSQLSDRIVKNHSRSGTINMIRLFSDGQYYIDHDRGSEWSLFNDYLTKELKKNQKDEDVAGAGDGSWIVIRPDYFASSNGIPTELDNKINEFFRLQRERNRARKHEIQQYHERERAREIAEREARETAEREAREAAERAAREEEEERRVEEERRRRNEIEKARKAAEELRATTLEVKLVEKLAQEKESIDKLETKLEVMQDHLGVMQDHFSTMQDDLHTRKRSLRESLVALPPAQRPRWNLAEDKPSKKQEKTPCVICQDKAPVRAVVPCGHLCLCDDCASSISQRPSNDGVCPLCRGPATSTLRIYS